MEEIIHHDHVGFIPNYNPCTEVKSYQLVQRKHLMKSDTLLLIKTLSKLQTEGGLPLLERETSTKACS